MTIRSFRGWQLMLVAAAAFSGSFARTAISPLQESIHKTFPLTDNQMALLQGPALALPLLLVSVPLGLMIDRCSRVRLLLVCAAIVVVGTVLSAAAPDFSLFFAARCLVGLAAFAVNPVAISLIADLYPPHRRGRALMVMAIGQFAGMAAAFGLGGALIAAFEAPGWRQAVMWQAAPLIPLALAMLALREPARAEQALASPSVRESAAELWRFRKSVVPLLLGVVLVEIAIGAVLVWTAPALSRSLALSPKLIGTIMAAGLIVSGIVGPLAGGFLADITQRTRGPRRTLSALGYLALASAVAGLFALGPEVISVSAALFVFMIAIGALVVMATTLFTIVVPNELRGVCMSVLAAACVLFGTGIAPLTVSLLSGAIGGAASVGSALALVCAASGLLAAAVFTAAKRGFPASAAV